MGGWWRRVWGEDEAEPIWKRGQSLQQDALKGLYMGRHVVGFFFFFLLLWAKKGDFTRQAWLMLLIDLSCWAKHKTCLRLSRRGPFWGYVSLHRHNLKQSKQTCISFSEIFSMLNASIYMCTHRAKHQEKRPLYITNKMHEGMRSLFLAMVITFSLILEATVIGGHALWQQMLWEILPLQISFVPHPRGHF